MRATARAFLAAGAFFFLLLALDISATRKCQVSDSETLQSTQDIEISKHALGYPVFLVAVTDPRTTVHGSGLDSCGNVEH